jgi:hypothetical protein
VLTGTDNVLHLLTTQQDGVCCLACKSLLISYSLHVLLLLFSVNTVRFGMGYWRAGMADDIIARLLVGAPCLGRQHLCLCACQCPDLLGFVFRAPSNIRIPMLCPSFAAHMFPHPLPHPPQSIWCYPLRKYVSYLLFWSHFAVLLPCKP